MTKLAQRVTAAVFCLFLAGFGLAHVLLPDRDFSPVENRSLEGLPAFSWSALADGGYTAGRARYLAAQFPRRSFTAYTCAETPSSTRWRRPDGRTRTWTASAVWRR